jgi:hypothetical protein
LSDRRVVLVCVITETLEKAGLKQSAGRVRSKSTH